MNDGRFKPGDRVRTPARAEGVVVTVHRGPPRGRMWREPVYFVEIAGMRYPAAYSESELAPRESI